ncbi:MAG: cytochrome C, partial [Planctomycetota bacterium]
EAYAKDEAIEWRRVHKLPDYVRNFPHHVHLQAGVSCFSCHGQIMGMPVVYQAHSLSMAWCLDCHRNPEPHLVPPDKVTDLAWVEEHLAERAKDGTTGVTEARALIESLHRAPPQTCFACHH